MNSLLLVVYLHNEHGVLVHEYWPTGLGIMEWLVWKMDLRFTNRELDEVMLLMIMYRLEL